MVKRLTEGEDTRRAIADLADQLELLFAEKRWLCAGGLSVSKQTSEVERRVRMSLHKYRYSSAYDMPTIEMQLEGA